MTEAEMRVMAAVHEHVSQIDATGIVAVAMVALVKSPEKAELSAVLDIGLPAAISGACRRELLDGMMRALMRFANGDPGVQEAAN